MMFVVLLFLIMKCICIFHKASFISGLGHLLYSFDGSSCKLKVFSLSFQSFVLLLSTRFSVNCYASLSIPSQLIAYGSSDSINIFHQFEQNIFYTLWATNAPRWVRYVYMYMYIYSHHLFCCEEGIKFMFNKIDCVFLYLVKLLLPTLSGR